MPRTARSVTAARQARLNGGTLIVLAYIRVSTGEQVDSGAGLAAQRTAIDAEASRRGWTVEYVTDEGISAKTVTDRPALMDALVRLNRGDADILVASKLDRVSRSVADFAGMLTTSMENGWKLVLLDLGVDTSTPVGEMIANSLANMAQFERRIISQRTRDALAELKAQGVRLGRAPQIPVEVVQQIVDMSMEGGWSLADIANSLNDDEVPTVSGKPWSRSTIQSVLNGKTGQSLLHKAADGLL
jgi:DNA invertase Pin-like site-specific DNA recombinase